MTQDLNSVTLTGELADDPELRYTGSDTAICNLRLKVTNVYQNNGEWNSSDSYFTLQAWGNKGEQMGQNLQQGDRIRVQGELTINSFEDRDGNMVYKTEVKVQSFGTETQAGGHAQPDPQPTPSDQRRPQQNQRGGQQQRGGSSGQQGGQDTFEPDDELPF